LQLSEYFSVIYHCFQQNLVKNISSDVLNVGEEEETAWGGKVQVLLTECCTLGSKPSEAIKKKKYQSVAV